MLTIAGVNISEKGLIKIVLIVMLIYLAIACINNLDKISDFVKPKRPENHVKASSDTSNKCENIYKFVDSLYVQLNGVKTKLRTETNEDSIINRQVDTAILGDEISKLKIKIKKLGCETQ